MMATQFQKEHLYTFNVFCAKFYKQRCPKYYGLNIFCKCHCEFNNISCRDIGEKTAYEYKIDLKNHVKLYAVSINII